MSTPDDPTPTRAPHSARGDLYWLAADDSRGPSLSCAHPHVVVQDDVFRRARR